MAFRSIAGLSKGTNMRYVAKYRCSVCQHTWKVRNTSAGRKECEGENCTALVSPYKKEAIDIFVTYKCPVCTTEKRQKRCISEINDLPYCMVCSTDMEIIPRRMYGTYICNNCNHGWKSGQSWVGKKQQCKNCFADIYPVSLRPLQRSGNQAPLGREPHQQHLCEMCKTLGTNCKSLASHKDNGDEEEDDLESVISQNSSFQGSEVGDEDPTPPPSDGELTPTGDYDVTDDVTDGAILRLASMKLQEKN